MRLTYRPSQAATLAPNHSVGSINQSTLHLPVTLIQDIEKRTIPGACQSAVNFLLFIAFFRLLIVWSLTWSCARPPISLPTAKKWNTFLKPLSVLAVSSTPIRWASKNRHSNSWRHQQPRENSITLQVSRERFGCMNYNFEWQCYSLESTNYAL